MLKKYDISLLYVEDNKDERETLSKKLKPMFKELFLACDGEEGLEIFKEKTPDLILTDYQMPNLNGIEMVKEIRYYDPNIPIIMFTGYTDTEPLMQAIKYNINSYITKPIVVEDFFASLNKNAKAIIEKKENNRIIHLLTQYKNTVDISSIVSISDLDGNIKYVNNQFEDISGYTKDELIGQPHNIVRHPDMQESVFEDLWHTIKDKKQPWFGILKNRKKDGSSYYVDSVINPILDNDGNIVEYIGIRRDITKVMSPKKQLIGKMKSMSEPTLILIKICNYEIIKEFYHDKIRRRFEQYFTSHLLKLCEPHFDIHKVYALSDGLFGIVENKNYNESEIYTKIDQIIENSKKENVEFQDNKFEIDLIFSFASKSLHQFDDALMGIERIDSKNDIINACNLYEIVNKEAIEKLETLNLIKDALKDGDRVVSFYQPIVCNETREIVKYESLIRLITEDDKVLSPFHFMDIAKKTGYYEDLTYKVIENASKILEIDKKIEISINLSSSDIEDTKARLLLMDLVANEENANRITFELLEDEETKDLSMITDFISLAKEIGGVKISIDDFGSGYSNYERLSQFQPDFIKIDGSLIKDILENKYNESVLKSLVVFAKENNIKTIAEFVSSQEIYERITELGVDYSQGYYFGKPEPIIQ